MRLGELTGYRFGMWLVDRIPDTVIAWLADNPRVRVWALKSQPYDDAAVGRVADALMDADPYLTHDERARVALRAAQEADDEC